MERRVGRGGEGGSNSYPAASACSTPRDKKGLFGPHDDTAKHHTIPEAPHVTVLSHKHTTTCTVF